jgi:hypothetical protein
LICNIFSRENGFASRVEECVDLCELKSWNGFEFGMKGYIAQAGADLEMEEPT